MQTAHIFSSVENDREPDQLISDDILVGGHLPK